MPLAELASSWYICPNKEDANPQRGTPATAFKIWAFVLLFYIEIVILPLFFDFVNLLLLCHSRSTGLPLLRHPPLTVLNFVQKT